MKIKMIAGVTAACLILGGAIGVAAHKGQDDGVVKMAGSDDRVKLDDSVKHGTEVELENEKIEVENEQAEMENEKVEIEVEEEHGKTYTKVEVKGKQGTDDSSPVTGTEASSTSLAKAKTAALKKVPGTVSKIEKELEHGRLEYKFEIQTDRGEAEVRVDAATGKITRTELDDKEDDQKDRDGKKKKDDD